jgi:hypothetical protein
MRLYLSIIFIGLVSFSFAQTENTTALLDSAKNIFKGLGKEYNERVSLEEYYKVQEILEEVIKINPENTEARYFLGYTYSRINSYDARGVISIDLDLVYKSSEQFESIIKLSPYYEKEIIILDPYSKISAEWGSLALKYLYLNKPDSATWAFQEGKKRGGFGEYVLSHHRMVLDTCSKNAVLMSSGDNSSFTLIYLQTVEKYRTDVAVVEINLLNTEWYPRYLYNTNTIQFDLPIEIIDSLEYVSINDSIITIQDFTWTVYPSYNNSFLLRGDRIFLSFLNVNQFERDVYFTMGMHESSKLSLHGYLNSLIIIEKLEPFKKEKLDYVLFKENIHKLLSLVNLLSYNSQDEFNMFHNIKYYLLKKAEHFHQSGDNKKAKELLNIFENIPIKENYPKKEQFEEYFEYLKKSIHSKK